MASSRIGIGRAISTRSIEAAEEALADACAATLPAAWCMAAGALSRRRLWAAGLHLVAVVRLFEDFPDSLAPADASLTLA